MQWWYWLSSGLILLGLEMFTPTGMYLLIIGLAFVAVGLLTAIGLLASLQVQSITAAILTAIFIVVLRRPFQALIKKISKPMTSDITAQIVAIEEAIEPGAIGKGQLSGAGWSVRNESGAVLHAGARHSVARVDGLTLVVKE